MVGVGVASGGLGPRLRGAIPARIVIAAPVLLRARELAWHVAMLTPASDYFAVMLPAMLAGGTGTGLTFRRLHHDRKCRESPRETAASPPACSPGPSSSLSALSWRFAPTMVAG